MGGSGGGGPFVKRSPEKLREIVRKAEEKTTVAEFESDLAEIFGGLLADLNGRDVDEVQRRLDNLKDLLEDSVDETMDQLFGGSVAKRTYVDGLSDIDSLVFVDDTGLETRDTSEVIQWMEEILQSGLGDEAEVSRGSMAVTVSYPDGMEIQLLPAVRAENDKIKVPSSRGHGWSRIDPVAFQRALTRRNQECSGKLIPTIKLAKAINGRLPKNQQLTGYHMESLGIAAFRAYEGDKTTTAMLPRFFERARDLVLSPIKDSTGQSVHVDDYLGPANSEARIAAGHVMGRIARRMRNASAAGSEEQWRALFGLE